MKWVAITLLLLNGIFLAVQLNKQEVTEQAAAVERFPQNAPELVLVAEKEKLDKAKQFAEKQRQQKLAQAKAVAAGVEPMVNPSAADVEVVAQQLSAAMSRAGRNSRCV